MSHKYKKDIGAILHANGVTFRVWAPFAESVAVRGHFNNWSDDAMKSEGDGYWSTHIRHAIAGQEYKFAIKNGDQLLVRSDPRALHFTVNSGSSVIVDPEFNWEDDTFQAPPREQQVIYEMHLGTFNRADAATTGTFKTAEEKLDHLAALGINMIELMPINSMMFDRGWGYNTSYIYAIESLYGGRYEFKNFVKGAHARGIGVIVDVVYNHFAVDSNFDLWQFDGWSKDGRGGIYFYSDWRADTPWGARPDYGRLEVQQYIVDNIAMWLHECNIDGLRVDSTIYMRNVKGYNNDPSTDLPEGWQIMQQINSIAKKINGSSLMIAEDVGNNEYLTKPSAEGGAGFDTQWEVQFPGALREALASDDPAHINLSGLLGIIGRRHNDDPMQRVIYADSHDSAANGSARLNECVSPGKATNDFAKRQSILAAGIVLTSPGIPMLFQGQEFLETGSFNDWQRLDWSKAERYSGILTAYQHMIALRKNQHGATAGLTGRGFNIMHLNENDKVIGYHRWMNGGPGDDTMVIINFSKAAFSDYVMYFPRLGTWKVRFNSSWQGYDTHEQEVPISEVIVESGEASMSLPPSSILILSQDS